MVKMMMIMVVPWMNLLVFWRRLSFRCEWGDIQFMWGLWHLSVFTTFSKDDLRLFCLFMLYVACVWMRECEALHALVHLRSEEWFLSQHHREREREIFLLISIICSLEDSLSLCCVIEGCAAERGDIWDGSIGRSAVHATAVIKPRRWWHLSKPLITAHLFGYIYVRLHAGP